jgi:sugar lactone lactonase YvrE
LGALLLALGVASLVSTSLSLGLASSPAAAATLVTPTTVFSTNSPDGITFDSAGNLFVSNFNTNTVSVLPVATGMLFGVPVTAGVPAILIPASAGLNGPAGIAFDAAGNLFVVSDNTSSVAVLPKATGTLFGKAVTANTLSTLVSSGLNFPASLAFDAAGNLFIGNGGGNTISVLPKATGTLFGKAVTANTLSTLVPSGVANPTALVFDSAGNLFIANTANSTVSVLPKTTTTLFGVPVTANTLATVVPGTAGLDAPDGLAFDSAGNLFIVDSGDIHGFYAVSVLAPNATTILGVSVPANTATTVENSGLQNPAGVAFSAGVPYVANSSFNTVVYLSNASAGGSGSGGGGAMSAPLPPGAPINTYGPPTSANYNPILGTNFTDLTATATATLNAPPGILPQGTSISIYPTLNTAGITLPAGQSYVVSFAVSWILPGRPMPVATAPLTLTISDPYITPSDAFYQETASGLTPVSATATNGSATFSFTSDPAFVVTTPGAPPPQGVSPTTPTTAAYDLVGSDGGVFAFGNPAGYFGSLPGLGIHVDDIVGMVPTPSGQGYYLVGSDGGVFAFGNAPYWGSLPGSGVHVSDIVGLVPSPNGLGYLLVGRDGGVFTFGKATYANSLPGLGIREDNIVGIASTPDGGGYWLASSAGGVWDFGDAVNYGETSSGPIVSIAATPQGGGYWLAGANGGVFGFGKAGFYGSLPGLGVKASDIVSLVPSTDGLGYLLVGRDGGIFAFGDATYPGSLPGLGVKVDDIVGAVPAT